MDPYTRRSVEPVNEPLSEPVVGRQVIHEERIVTPNSETVVTTHQAPSVPANYPVDPPVSTVSRVVETPAPVAATYERVVETPAPGVTTYNRMTETRVPTSAYAAGKSNQILWYILGVLEALLALRFVLRLIGANPFNGFASFIYSITGILVGPFASLLGTPALAGSALEITTLVAMLVYALIFWGLTRLLKVLVAPPTDRDIRP